MMGRITAIEPQKRRGDRRSIFVDGEFVVGAHEDVVVTLGLSIGQFFDTDTLEQLVRAETVRKARERALRLIAYRDRTVSEIRKRLIGSDFPEDVVNEVVKQMVQAELINDEKFSRDYVKNRSAAKPMGRKRLTWELRSKGAEPPAVEQALEGLDEQAEYRLALETAQKKIQKADRSDPKIKSRLSSFLARRGFGWEVIARVVGEVLIEED